MSQALQQIPSEFNFFQGLAHADDLVSAPHRRQTLLGTPHRRLEVRLAPHKVLFQHKVWVRRHDAAQHDQSHASLGLCDPPLDVAQVTRHRVVFCPRLGHVPGDPLRPEGLGLLQAPVKSRYRRAHILLPRDPLLFVALPQPSLGLFLPLYRSQMVHRNPRLLVLTRPHLIGISCPYHGQVLARRDTDCETLPCLVAARDQFCAPAIAIRHGGNESLDRLALLEKGLLASHTGLTVWIKEPVLSTPSRSTPSRSTPSRSTPRPSTFSCHPHPTLSDGVIVHKGLV